MVLERGIISGCRYPAGVVHVASDEYVGIVIEDSGEGDQSQKHCDIDIKAV